MLREAERLADGARLQAEVAIVGAGAAGIALALELAARGRSVVVLETGGRDRPPQRGLAAMLLNGRRVSPGPRACALGGSTQVWGGWCVPLADDVFGARDAVPGGAWPIDGRALAPWLERAARTLELGDPGATAETAAERLGLETVRAAAVESRLLQRSPTRFGDRYAAALDASERVAVWLGATVTEIELEPDLGRVARLRGRAGEVGFTVEAQRFVLASGGLEVPRLLLASRGQRPEGVANGSGRVGRGYMEHPHYYGGALLLSRGAELELYATWSPALPRLDGGGEPVPARAFLAPRAAVRRAEGLPHGGATVSPVEGVPAGLPTGALDPAALAALDGSPGARWLALDLRMEQAPRDENRFALADERDPYGVPRIDLRWGVDAADRRAAARTLEILGAGLAAAGVGRLWSPTDAAGGVLAPHAGGNHHLGTARMSARPEDGVVDAECRCHEHPNLYVAGSAVFPSGGVVNPTLTLVALAHRLAHHLAEAS